MEMEKVTELEREGDLKGAFQECHRLAEGGLYEAQLNLALMYQFGKGTEEDIEASKKWYLNASKTSDAIDRLEAQYYLASLYRRNGEYTAAFELMEKTANKGFLPAAFRLGEMLSKGIGCKKDDELGKYYREYAAGHGHAWAQRNVAARMIRGQYGAAKIPLGLVKFVVSLAKIFVESFRDPHSQKGLV